MANRIPPVQDWERSKEHLEKVIDNWIFNADHREIIKRRMFNAEDLHDIADSKNLSYERTREIYYEGRKIVFKHKDE